MRGALNQLEDALVPDPTTAFDATDAVGGSGTCDDNDGEGANDRIELVRRAAAIYRMRRARDRLFDGDLFGEGAWDVLLDLYVREAVGKRTYVSSACGAAAVPATTALRCIGQLHETGLLEREPDPLDGRRVFVKLTPLAHDRLHAVLRHAVPPPA